MKMTCSPAWSETMWSETNRKPSVLTPPRCGLAPGLSPAEFMLAAETLGDLYRKGERILSLPGATVGEFELIHEGDTVSVLPWPISGIRSGPLSHRIYDSSLAPLSLLGDRREYPLQRAFLL